MHGVTGGALVSLAFLVAPQPLAFGLAGVATGAGLALHHHLTARRAPSVDLVIDRSGEVRYTEDGGVGWRGRLHPASWQRDRVAVISVILPWGRVFCPIYRSRQAPGQYRRLRVWLRHGRVLRDRES